jgi:GntR family transcriptional regulator / MocR family aminotransferase
VSEAVCDGAGARTVAPVEVFIDPGDDRGLAEQVYVQVRDAITAGRLIAGDVVTPSRVLAAQLGISRFTVAEAYTRLAAEGYVEGRRRGGTVVTDAVAPTPQLSARTAIEPRALAASITRYDNGATAHAPRHDLRAGTVDPSVFPLTAWRRCATAVMSAAPPQYGDPTGAAELRSALAHWIGRTRGVVASAEEVVVTSGALHGMDLVLRALVGPGDVAAVEEPGYPPAVELLRSHDLTVVGVPVDSHGLVVDAIPPSARLVYVTPSHQYPLGVVLSRSRRLELLRWAGQHEATIVEDDYDSQFRYATRPLEPLQRLDPDGRVVYLGTFSKVLSPSLRVGFAVVPRSIIPAVGALRLAVDWCPPWPTQPTLTRFIVDGYLDRHIARATRQYRARRDEIMRRLGRSPVPVRPLPASAGLHVAVLVDGDDTGDDRVLHEATVAEDVLVGSLRRCYRFSTPPGGLILGFGSLKGRDLTDAMDAVDRVLIRVVKAKRRVGAR